MKPTARLINTSRGPIVNEQALNRDLARTGHCGKRRSTFSITEPLPAKHPFRSLENLLATPHIGFVAEDLYRTFYGDARRRSEPGSRSRLEPVSIRKERGMTGRQPVPSTRGGFAEFKYSKVEESSRPSWPQGAAGRHSSSAKMSDKDG